MDSLPALAKLIALRAGLVLAAGGVQSLVDRSERGQRSGPRRWMTVAAAAILASAVLSLYPERFIVDVWAHLLTVVASAVILFATTRALLLALVPDTAIDAAPESFATQRLSRRTSRWAIVTLVGAAFGAFAFLGELSEGGGGQSVAQIIAVAGVFLGLAITGVGVAFGFLGAPLGLGGSPRRSLKGFDAVWH